jgi:hypothetical protein
MFRCGDSLHVHEYQRRETLVFGIEGGYARHYRLVGPDDRFNTPYMVACGPSGTFIANGWDTVRVAEWQRVRGTVPFWLTDPEGRVTRVLGSWPGSERFSGPNGSGPHPLGKEPVIAVGRTRSYLGTADSFAIEVFTLDGTPLPPIVKPRVDLATNPADIEFSRLLDTLGKSESLRQRMMRDWDRYDYPATVPAYTALVVDRDDNLWVRTFPRIAASPVRWVVFDGEGAEVGSIDLPATLAAYDIGPDWILGIEVSLDDGAQRVVKYRLHRE